ncbi:hypothetical protein F9003_23970 [Bacteroides fragilis]|nr:hypothetical protein F9003_23970 [Bacteroides fragilis]
MNSSDISTDQYYKNIFPQYQSLKSGVGAGSNRDPIKEMSVSLPMLIKRIKESLRVQEQRGLRSRLKRKHIKFGKTMRNSLDDDDEDGDVDPDAETSSGMGEKVDDKDKQIGKRNRRVNRRRSEEEDTIYEGSAFYTINDFSLESNRFS